MRGTGGHLNPRPCRKIRYRTREIAEATIENKTGQTGYTAVRAYRCPYCRHWHVTSKPHWNP